MSRLRDRATELEIQINADLFDSARVIASTLVSSNHRLLNGRRFSTLFIDEAAQALEAACWIAIRKADRVILAGDHCQMYRSFPWRIGSYINGKSRSTKTFRGLSIKSTVQNA